MKICAASAKQIQWFMKMLINDSMAPTYLAGGNYPNAWQFAVEAVYRLKICELVDFDFDVLTKSEKFPDTTYHGLNDFCYHLSITEPNDWGCLIWIDAQMHFEPSRVYRREVYLSQAA